MEDWKARAHTHTHSLVRKHTLKLYAWWEKRRQKASDNVAPKRMITRHSLGMGRLAFFLSAFFASNKEKIRKQEKRSLEREGKWKKTEEITKQRCGTKGPSIASLSIGEKLCVSYIFRVPPQFPTFLTFLPFCFSCLIEGKRSFVCWRRSVRDHVLLRELSKTDNIERVIKNGRFRISGREEACCEQYFSRSAKYSTEGW